MNIAVILGTAREGRQSEKVARWLMTQVELTDATAELIDVREYGLSTTDNSEKTKLAQKYVNRIEAADAIVLVVPEYNHGYPGELKMTLDLCYKQYAGLPVLLCGVSSGGLGGARAVEQMNLVVLALGMVPMQYPLYFSNVQDLFNEDGNPSDDSYEKRANKSLELLTKYAEALKAIR